MGHPPAGRGVACCVRAEPPSRPIAWVRGPVAKAAPLRAAARATRCSSARGRRDALDLTRLPGRMTRSVTDTLGDIGDVFREPVIRLGVTGLSRAGKTVFITSLVANLIDRGRMHQLRAAAEGRILAAWLQPHPDHSMPRFAYEDHLDALTGARAALAGEHPLDLDAAPVAAGRAEGPDRRDDRAAQRASRHRRLSRRVAARPAADEPGLRGRGRPRPSPPPAPRDAPRTRRPASPSSKRRTPPSPWPRRPPAGSRPPSPPTSPPPAPPASPASPPAAS